MKSKDLRLAVINYYKENKNKVQNIQNEIKHIFNVSHMSLYRWLKNIDHEEMGRPKKSYKIDEKTTLKIIDSLEVINPENFIKTAEKSNISISKKTAYNILHRQNYTHKKVSINRNKDDPDKIKQKRNAVLDKINETPKNKLISFDESFMSLETLTNEYGWSKKGERCITNVNGANYKDGKSMLLAISDKKVISSRLIKGPVNGENVKDFFNQ
jgi:transposase